MEEPLGYEARQEKESAFEFVALAVTAAFFGASIWVMAVAPLFGLRFKVIFGTWAVCALVAAVMAWRVRRRAKGRPWEEGRAARWATGLTIFGVVVGLLALFGSGHANPRVANRVRCSSNMRQIAMAILAYSNANANHYPERLEQLIETQDIGSEVFVCPSTEDTHATGPTTRAVMAAMTAGGHLSYTYVGAGLMNDCDVDTVVMFEPLSNHGGDGMCVLFGDGHVDWLKAAEARGLVDRIGSGERPVIWRWPTASGPATKP